MSERTLAEIVAEARRHAPGWQSDDLERLLAVAEAAEAVVAKHDTPWLDALRIAVRGGAK